MWIDDRETGAVFVRHGPTRANAAWIVDLINWRYRSAHCACAAIASRTASGGAIADTGIENWARNSGAVQLKPGPKTEEGWGRGGRKRNRRLGDDGLYPSPSDWDSASSENP